MPRFLYLLGIIWLYALNVCASNGGLDAIPDFQADVRPILERHCFTCHDVDTAEGGVTLEKLSTDLIANRSAAETWHQVMSVLNAGQMPPEDEPEIPRTDFETLSLWISTKVEKAIEARRKTDGRVVMRRLNQTEYQNTMRDLLGIDMDFVRDFPPDAISPEGYDNEGRFLQFSAMQLEYYLDTARRAMDRVIVEGPPPMVYDYEFDETNLQKWKGNAEKSNRLGRQQEFLATMVDDYPEAGEFLVRVTLTAEQKPDVGFPLLEVSVGYRPDTQILLREFDLVEITSEERQVYEFRGRLEEFPLPVRGQGKFPGLVVRVRNVYDDGSQLPKIEQEKGKQAVYADEPHLPKIVIESVTFQGPVFAQWPPRSHRALLFDSPRRDENVDEYVRAVLKRFMGRAFRRPVTPAELNRIFEHYQTIRADFPSFEEAMRETLSMVLIQPSFLYRIEPSGDEKRPITDWELASRLSYFLWSTMPDERLRRLAEKSKLRRSKVLRREVLRMLDDQRGSRFVDQFCRQWFQLDRLTNISVDKNQHRDFDDQLKDLMGRETQSFFSELVRRNLSANQLIDSDFMMLNERLASHYGIEGVVGNSMRSVPVPSDKRRGGVLGQASVLLINSTGKDSHPIRRAVWIRDRLLDDPPAPPPPDVPSLEDGDPEFHQLSIRRQLEIHRQKPACAGCHRDIDPWGLALENFDATGTWRDRTDGNENSDEAINVLPDGSELTGFEDLKRYLIGQRGDDFARSLVKHLLTYSLGRRLELADEPTLNRLIEQAKKNDLRMRDLVVGVVLSEPFLTK